MKPRSFYYSCTPEADRETQFESFRSMGAHESEIFIDVWGTESRAAAVWRCSSASACVRATG